MGIEVGTALLMSSAAGAGASIYSAKKAQGAQNKNFGSIAGIFGQDKSILGDDGLLAGGFGTQMMKAEQAIYDPEYGLVAGMGDIDQFGQTAREDTLRREQEARSGLVRRNQASGLFTSSQMENAFRGLSHDTNRSLRAIDESMAQLRLGQRNQIAAAIGATGDIAAQQSLAQANFASQYGGMLSNRQYGSSPVNLGGLGGMAAMMAMNNKGGGGGYAPGVGGAGFGASGTPGGWWSDEFGGTIPPAFF